MLVDSEIGFELTLVDVGAVGLLADLLALLLVLASAGSGRGGLLASSGFLSGLGVSGLDRGLSSGSRQSKLQ